MYQIRIKILNYVISCDGRIFLAIQKLLTYIIIDNKTSVHDLQFIYIYIYIIYMIYI